MNSLKKDASEASSKLANAIWKLAGDIKWIGIKLDKSDLKYHLVVGAGPKTNLSVIPIMFENYYVNVVLNAKNKAFPVPYGNC